MAKTVVTSLVTCVALLGGAFFVGSAHAATTGAPQVNSNIQASCAEPTEEGNHVFRREFPSCGECRADGDRLRREGLIRSYNCVPITGTTRFAQGVLV